MAESVSDLRPVIVAGLGRLGLRITQLLRGHGVPVRVITGENALAWHLRLAEEAGAELFSGDFRDPEIWVLAGATECQAAIVTSADDSRNLETSIRVKRLAPDLRMVTRVDAPHLGHRLERDFGLHAALCPAVISASQFVISAMESRGGDTPPPQGSRFRRRRKSWHVPVLVLLGTCLVTGTIVFHFAKNLAWVDALYFTVAILTTVGFGDYHLQHDAWPLKLFGILLMLAGITLIALLVSLFSNSLITGGAGRAHQERAARRRRRHVIVAGMGSLGHAVVRDFHQRGVPVVCIERNGISAADAAVQQHIPVIEGDATEAETLLRAGIERARAVMAVTSTDGINLEVALRARTLADQQRPACPLPVIIACQDELLAARLRAAGKSYVPMSSAEIAAPVFVAAALGLKHLP